jgi:hypothetical protein
MRKPTILQALKQVHGQVRKCKALKDADMINNFNVNFSINSDLEAKIDVKICPKQTIEYINVNIGNSWER